MDKLVNRIYIAKFDTYVGNFAHNIEEIVKSISQALELDKDIIVTSELSLCGYPPEDLIKRGDWTSLAMDANENLLSKISEIDGEFHLFFGNVYEPKNPEIVTKTTHRSEVYNCYFEAKKDQNGSRIVRRIAKRDLPNYSVFDEARYFTSGLAFNIKNKLVVKNTQNLTTDEADTSISVAICEDVWNDVPLNIIPDSKLIIVPNASPFEVGKNPRRIKACQKLARAYKKDVLYFNAVGAQDELVFDDAVIHVSASGQALKSPPEVSEYEQIYTAIMQGLRSYFTKNGFAKMVLGLSGGIDSALVATLAVDSLGCKSVHGILMPSQYSSDHSVADAENLAHKTGVSTTTVQIQPIFDGYADSIPLEQIARENLQARIRGNILMAYSNSSKKPCLVLATGNKSELAVGYSTIYGDAVGGYAPIKDVLKTKVWELARWRNSLSAESVKALNLQAGEHPIPDNSIAKPPSAELSPGQFDQQTLPEYDVLDAIIIHLMEGSPLNTSINQADIEKVRYMMKVSEWKRKQYPLGPKLTHVAFGKDWRMPIS